MDLLDFFEFFCIEVLEMLYFHKKNRENFTALLTTKRTALLRATLPGSGGSPPELAVPPDPPRRSLAPLRSSPSAGAMPRRCTAEGYAQAVRCRVANCGVEDFVQVVKSGAKRCKKKQIWFIQTNLKN